MENMRLIFLAFGMVPFLGFGQELFTFSEPASNMAAKSIGFRLNNHFLNVKNSSLTNYHLIPEVMIGVSRKWMLHGELFSSNKAGRFKFEGVGTYVKYRLFSVDDVHSHFRVAAFGRAAYNKSEIQQPAIDLAMNNSGYEAGIIATKLINKIALSGSASLIHAADNGEYKFKNAGAGREAAAYILSAGKLLLPKEYIDYNQVNMNIMLEFPGQVNMGSGKGFLDVAPSLQFIFLSRMRLDIGYRTAIIDDLERMAGSALLVRFEYNIFNAF